MVIDCLLPCFHDRMCIILFFDRRMCIILERTYRFFFICFRLRFFFFLTKCLNVNVQRVVLPLCNFITHFLYLLLWLTVLRNFNGISYGVG